MTAVGWIAIAVLMPVALIPVSIPESRIAVSCLLAAPTWLCAVRTPSYVSALRRRWWAGSLVAELPAIKFVGFFEGGEVAWSGWQRVVAEVGVFQGIDGVYSLSPVEFKQFIQERDRSRAVSNIC
jgi:hypothetical protein